MLGGRATTATAVRSTLGPGRKLLLFFVLLLVVYLALGVPRMYARVATHVALHTETASAIGADVSYQREMHQ